MVVHEIAHIFHNYKRERVGLPFNRRREWLLDIDFHKRETFAYAREAFARVPERARGVIQLDRSRGHPGRMCA